MDKVEEKIDGLFESYTMLVQMVPYAMGVAEKEHTMSIMHVAKLSNLVAEMLLHDSEDGAKIVMESLAKLSDRCEKMCREMKEDENFLACADECKRIAELCRS